MATKANLMIEEIDDIDDYDFDDIDGMEGDLPKLDNEKKDNSKELEDLDNFDFDDIEDFDIDGDTIKPKGAAGNKPYQSNSNAKNDIKNKSDLDLDGIDFDDMDSLDFGNDDLPNEDNAKPNKNGEDNKESNHTKNNNDEKSNDDFGFDDLDFSDMNNLEVEESKHMNGKSNHRNSEKKEKLSASEFPDLDEVSRCSPDMTKGKLMDMSLEEMWS